MTEIKSAYYWHLTLAYTESLSPNNTHTTLRCFSNTANSYDDAAKEMTAEIIKGCANDMLVVEATIEYEGEEL